MTSRDAFGSFTLAAFNTKNIPVFIAVMINPSSTVFNFFPIKTTDYGKSNEQIKINLYVF